MRIINIAKMNESHPFNIEWLIASVKLIYIFTIFIIKRFGEKCVAGWLDGVSVL